MFKVSDFEIGQTAYMELINDARQEALEKSERIIKPCTVEKIKDYGSVQYVQADQIKFCEMEGDFIGLVNLGLTEYVLYPSKKDVEEKIEKDHLLGKIHAYFDVPRKNQNMSISKLRAIVKILDKEDFETPEGSYVLYGQKLVDDDSSLDAFAKCIYDSLPIEAIDVDPDSEEFNDRVLELAHIAIYDDLSRTKVDYKQLLFRYAPEIGVLLYNMDNYSISLSVIEESGFFTYADETFNFLLEKYILIKYIYKDYHEC